MLMSDQKQCSKNAGCTDANKDGLYEAKRTGFGPLDGRKHARKQQRVIYSIRNHESGECDDDHVLKHCTANNITVGGSETTTSLPPPVRWNVRVTLWADKNINENLRFSMRVTLAISLASLFVVCQSPDPKEQKLPSGIWVYITAVLTSWQVSPDLGSVFKKSWQRFVGTVLGGIIGLGLGAISLSFPSKTMWQDVYLGSVQIFMAYGIAFFSCKWGFKSHYSALLASITAGLALLSFHSTQPEESWKVGVFRIVNIAIGGIISSFSSLVVFPISTKLLMERRVKKLCRETGSAAREVLLQSKRIGEDQEKNDIPSYLSMIVDGENDSAHDACLSCIDQLGKVKGMFPLLNYDPIFRQNSQTEKRNYIEACQLQLDRILRIHMNVICLDNILRSKLVGDDELLSDLLVTVGTHIEEIMDCSRSWEGRKVTELM